MLGTTAIRHPTPTRSFALTHSPWGGRGRNQSCAQDSPSTCTTFFLPRCAPTGTGTSSRSPQATAQSAWGPRAVGAHACGHRSCSSVRTLRSSSCSPKRVSTLELSERQVTPLALPQVPTPATRAHGRGSSSPHRGPQGYQRARRLQQAGQRERGLGTARQVREEGNIGLLSQAGRDNGRETCRDGDSETDIETETERRRPRERRRDRDAEEDRDSEAEEGETGRER